jgi:hypothetical protein
MLLLHTLTISCSAIQSESDMKDSNYISIDQLRNYLNIQNRLTRNLELDVIESFSSKQRNFTPTKFNASPLNSTYKPGGTGIDATVSPTISVNFPATTNTTVSAVSQSPLSTPIYVTGTANSSVPLTINGSKDGSTGNVTIRGTTSSAIDNFGFLGFLLAALVA